MEIRAKKSFGQNFLKDHAILKTIANTFEVEENDLIIEIGPGKGALTRYLQEKKCDVLAYEIDIRMQKVLSNLKKNVTIIYEDFLNRDIINDIKKEYNHIYVIANIPYYITTPIIEKIIRSELVINGMTLLVQKEVAERFIASPGTKSYGYFTAYLNYYYNIEKICNVKNTAFDPVPKVDSAVVLFTTKEPLKINSEDFLFNFMKNSFQFKRKNLRNNLKQYNNLNKIESILIKKGFSLQSRAENLSIEDFVDIVNQLTEE